MTFPYGAQQPAGTPAPNPGVVLPGQNPPAAAQPGAETQHPSLSFPMPPASAPAQVPSVPPAAAAAPAPSQPGRLALHDNMILDGEGVPPELRGRTWGQAKQVYAALADRYLATTAPATRPAQGTAPVSPAPAARPSAPAAPASGDETDFWSDPRATIRKEVAETVGQAISQYLQPVIQQSQASAVQQALGVAKQGISDWDQLEPIAIELMSAVPEQQRADPTSWINAARMARGIAMERGTYQTRPPQGGGNGNGAVPGTRVYAPPGGGPGAAVPAYAAPPSPHSFFTEAPTPPMTQQTEETLTDEERFSARQFGMSEADYIAWRRTLTRER